MTGLWIILSLWSICHAVHVGLLLACVKKRALIEKRQWLLTIFASALIIPSGVGLLLTWASISDGQLAEQVVLKVFSGRRWLLYAYPAFPLVYLGVFAGGLPKHPAPAFCWLYGFCAAFFGWMGVTFFFGTIF